MDYREAVAKVVSLCAQSTVVADFGGTQNAVRDAAHRCPLNSAHPDHPGNVCIASQMGFLGIDREMGYRIMRAADLLDCMGKPILASPDRDILLAELLAAGKLVGTPAPIVMAHARALADRLDAAVAP